VVDDLDVYARAGRNTAYVRTVTVNVADGFVDLEFVPVSGGNPNVSGIEVRQSDTPPPPPPSDFPTPATTGFRGAASALIPSGAVTSTHDGQVIQGLDITGNVKIIHSNVTVRDSRISFTSTYGLNVATKADGSCPVNVRFEYIDLDGILASESHIPIYSTGACGWTVDHAYIHNVGRSSRLINNNTLSNSYVFSNRTGPSGAHRGAASSNGGAEQPDHQ